MAIADFSGDWSGIRAEPGDAPIVQATTAYVVEHSAILAERAQGHPGRRRQRSETVRSAVPRPLGRQAATPVQLSLSRPPNRKPRSAWWAPGLFRLRVRTARFELAGCVTSSSGSSTNGRVAVPIASALACGADVVAEPVRADRHRPDVFCIKPYPGIGLFAHPPWPPPGAWLVRARSTRNPFWTLAEAAGLYRLRSRQARCSSSGRSRGGCWNGRLGGRVLVPDAGQPRNRERANPQGFQRAPPVPGASRPTASLAAALWHSSARSTDAYAWRAQGCSRLDGLGILSREQGRGAFVRVRGPPPTH